MLRVPNQSQGPIHYEWTPAELVRTNDVVLLSAIEALLTDARIPYLVTDRNVSVVAGSIEALPRRILVGDCCIADARRLLREAGHGRELPQLDETYQKVVSYQGPEMNAKVRKMALWAIIVVLLLSLFRLFQRPGQRSQSQEISFSQLLNEVDQSRVRDVVIQGPEIHGTFTDGRSFQAYAPNDPGLVQRLYGKGVQITARPQQNDVPWFVSMLVSWLPFVALIGVWIFLSRQMQAARGKDKRSPDEFDDLKGQIGDLKRQIDDIRRRLDRLNHNPDNGDWALTGPRWANGHPYELGPFAHIRGGHLAPNPDVAAATRPPKIQVATDCVAAEARACSANEIRLLVRAAPARIGRSACQGKAAAKHGESLVIGKTHVRDFGPSRPGLLHERNSAQQYRALTPPTCPLFCSRTR
jgi:hypothetical protein